MIDRLSEVDLPKRLATVSPPWLTATAAGFTVIGLAALVRMGLDMVIPGVVPFALLFPAMLLATLLAGWLAGVVALVVGGGLSWWFVMEPRFSFTITDGSAGLSLALFFVSGALIIAFAEAWRRSSLRAAETRTAKLEERELLLRELNHRVANNFQVVASVLELQLHRTDGEGRRALESALGRIRFIAEAHHDLYSVNQAQEIDVRDYLGRLTAALAGSILDPASIDLQLEAASMRMSRERAVSLGLVINELVTNAAKHAFPSGRVGTIRIKLAPREGGWSLLVADDGVGLPKDFAQRGGLGWGIVRAFARRAGGTIQARSEDGACFELRLDEETPPAASVQAASGPP